MGNSLKGISKKDQSLRIDTTFKLSAPHQSGHRAQFEVRFLHAGDGFASRIKNLGEVQVAQISTFNKVWASHEGGPDNLGATIFEPIGLPEGFSILGDWEHVMLRVSNFDGELKSVYVSKHNGGIWVDPFDLEFKEDGNKHVVYSSLHGHVIYPKQGTSLQGANGAGIRNDSAASNMVVDMAIGY
ncbi:hypothetical protein K1719_023117 [Acacia pycnantha]|nr:hypothetical protein K1719_023117 [Acacia pycnantha]